MSTKYVSDFLLDARAKHVYARISYSLKHANVFTKVTICSLHEQFTTVHFLTVEFKSSFYILVTVFYF